MDRKKTVNQTRTTGQQGEVRRREVREQRGNQTEIVRGAQRRDGEERGGYEVGGKIRREMGEEG
jgi:hypothetical protein